MADLVQELLRLRQSPEQIEARQARRARRQEALYAGLSGIVAEQQESPLHTRLGYSWNLNDSHDSDQDAWVPIGNMHPAAAAVNLVRDAFAQYEIAAMPRFRFVGMHRASGKGMHSIQDGQIDIDVELKPAQGRTEFLTIPVTVRSGAMLRPGIAFYEGQPQVMAQSLFDQVLQKADQDRDRVPSRGMFDPPGGGNRVEKLKWASVASPHAPDYAGPKLGQVPTAFDRRAYRGPSAQALRAAIQGVAGADPLHEPELPGGVEGELPEGVKLKEQLRAIKLQERELKAELRDLRSTHEASGDPSLVEHIQLMSQQLWALRNEAGALEERLSNEGALVPPRGFQHFISSRDVVAASSGSNEPREQPLASETWSWPSAPSPWGGPVSGDDWGHESAHLDPAEQPRPQELVLGSKVRISTALESMEVGSPALYTVPAGTSGVIVRDMDGTGRRFMVRLEQGSSVIVPASALSKR